MTHCPSCKSAVAAHALTCSQCGAALDDTSGQTAMLPAGYAFHTSPGGQKLFTGKLLEE